MILSINDKEQFLWLHVQILHNCNCNVADAGSWHFSQRHSPGIHSNTILVGQWFPSIVLRLPCPACVLVLPALPIADYMDEVCSVKQAEKQAGQGSLRTKLGNHSCREVK